MEETWGLREGLRMAKRMGLNRLEVEEVIHIFREANSCAAHFARMGQSKGERVQEFRTPQATMIQLIREDKEGSVRLSGSLRP
ncbi:hypothetical protein RJ641_008721 [Dillenia turbinata]|uniref:Uncharacterized protein n=1 Tax=Dillenia turbinata TaxID=194707 RepID=A0AAN8Z6T0_9MAGN